MSLEYGRTWVNCTLVAGTESRAVATDSFANCIFAPASNLGYFSDPVSGHYIPKSWTQIQSKAFDDIIGHRKARN
jgi:hypothetical protein